MSDGKLVRMANDIANFFQSYPDEEAITGIHDHIKAFWTPKMRAALTDSIGTGVPGIHRLVVAAMTRTPHGTSPTDKEAAGPAAVGEIGASDAG